MTAFVNYFKQIGVGFWSLLSGMTVTWRYMFKKPVTVQYPKEKLTMPKKFRGPIQFVLFEKTGSHNCIGCFLCANICPTDCYTIEAAKTEGGQKRPTKFIYNVLQCSLCNLCVQVCPTKTLEHSRDYETAGYSPEEYRAIDFISHVNKRAEEKGLTPKLDQKAISKEPPKTETKTETQVKEPEKPAEQPPKEEPKKDGN